MVTSAPDDQQIGSRLLLENDQVRIWELRLEPGEHSELHRHRHDYVMVQIAGDRVAARFEPDSEGTFAGSDYLEGPVIPGLPIYADAGGHETAMNVGEETFVEVVVEIKAQRTPGVLAVQHVAIDVADLDAALDFYTRVLDFAVLPRPDLGRGAWLSSGNGVQVHLVENSECTPAPGHHLAFETADIDAEIARLRGLGVEVADAFELFGTRQTFFTDPSGNQLELNQPPSS